MSKWFSAKVRVIALVIAGVAGSASYAVQPGDTLGSIGDQFGTTAQHLVASSRLAGANLTIPGQMLLTRGDRGSQPSTSHVVATGETLSGIARAHGVDTETLARTNGIVNGNVIVGTRLQLTPLPVSFEPALQGRSHVVAGGESVPSIARDHGVTETQVMELNHIHDPDRLEPGRILIIGPGWQCPVTGGTFSNDWGWVKPGGSTHDGIDIFAPRGTEIVAPVAGHLHQEEGPKGGLQFTLWGDDGVRYLGSHMDSFGAAGDVQTGAVIGTIGTSGNATGTSPHLHFEVHPGNGDRSANPYPVLLESCS